MTLICPDIARWEEFLADQLPGEEEARLDEHLQICPNCKDRLEALTNPATITRVADLLESVSSSGRLSNGMEQVMLSAVLDQYRAADVADRPLPVIPGYEIFEVIGQGGSGIVYRARDARLQRTVAIKVLRNNANAVQRQRFDQEGKALASLHHLNVAGIIEVGESQGTIYLVLEYIAGGSLALHIAGHPQPAIASARLVQQLAHAVQRAHEIGIIHRDLKPGNVLLDPHFGAAETTGLDQFVPKIIDFGIAKDLESKEEFTHTRDFLGTPSYMAPEQITHTRKIIDGRTDIYALGIILYEILTGRPPFRAASPIDTMLQIKHDEPVPPSRFEPKLPRDLENVCLKCIEKNPMQRYASAQALADDLERFLNHEPVQARPISWLARSWRWSKRNPGWAIALTLGLLMLLGCAIVGPLMAHRERMLREEAALERNRAQDHLNMAGRVLDEMLDRLLNNLRLQDTAFDDIQRGLVTFAIPYLEQFAQEESSGELLRLRQARSLLQLAMVQVKNKEIDKAESTYLRSLDLMTKLQPSAMLSDDILLKGLSSAHLEYGRFINMFRNNPDLAEKHYRLSLEYINQLDHGTNAPKYFDTYAIHYSLLASLLTELPERKEEGLSYSLKAIDYRTRLMEMNPERDDLRHYAALTHLNLAIFYRKQKLNAKEIEQLSQALELEKQVNRSKLVWIESPYFVSTLQGELGMAYYLNKQPEVARPYFVEASRTAEALCVVYPSVEKYEKLNKQWKRILAFIDKKK